MSKLRVKGDAIMSLARELLEVVASLSEGPQEEIGALSDQIQDLMQQKQSVEKGSRESMEITLQISDLKKRREELRQSARSETI